MTADELVRRFREVAGKPMPVPGAGRTAERHRLLMEIGREDLSLARLAEAHFDAVAILKEAGREPWPDALYGVWAAELPGKTLTLAEEGSGLLISGEKAFCSGAGIVDRALVTVDAPEPYLVDLDLRMDRGAIVIDSTGWKSAAFSLTKTATVSFTRLRASGDDVVKERGWYLSRPGFWHGACGPAACWAGGAAGLVSYARKQSRSDAHTLAHVGAMHALEWQMKSCLETAGAEIDARPRDRDAAMVRALTVRHLVEQAGTEILRRFARAYGPHPLAFNEDVGRRYQELDIYLRQSHAERDLEGLGRKVLDSGGTPG